MFLLGDEPVIVFCILIFLILIFIGWRSTYVPDFPLVAPPGVLASSLHHQSTGSLTRDLVVPVRGNLLNRLVDQITNSATAANSSGLRRRRLHHHHHHAARGPNRVNNNSVEEVEYNDQGNILMTHVLSWASNESISTGTNTEDTAEGRIRRHTEYLLEELQNEGPQAIIREMDRDLPQDATDSAPTAAGVGSSSSSAAAEEVQNCANENSENVNKQAGENKNPVVEEESPSMALINEDPWKIKIKYLNDDMKVVEARPSQTLGDFKRRNFIAELAANKLVRLVFNGKVLQPESTSLRSCGLFENCVVHCLVHNNMENRGNESRLGGGGQIETNSSMGLSTATPALQSGSRGDDGSAAGLSQRDVIAEGDTGGSLLLAPQIGDSPGSDSSSSSSPLRNCVDWFFVILNRFYNWRFFTELLLFLFTVITIYLRIRYAEYFTSTATIGLILVSVMVLGISITLNVM